MSTIVRPRTSVTAASISRLAAVDACASMKVEMRHAAMITSMNYKSPYIGGSIMSVACKTYGLRFPFGVRRRSGRMDCKIGKRATWLAAIAIALGVASVASAQVFPGRVEVTVEDAPGGRWPGVNVDLTGPVNQSQVTDAQGQAHFLTLPVGTYSIKAAIQGFNSYTNNEVAVATGAATPLLVRLGVAGTTETVNV